MKINELKNVAILFAKYLFYDAKIVTAKTERNGYNLLLLTTPNLARLCKIEAHINDKGQIVFMIFGLLDESSDATKEYYQNYVSRYEALHDVMIILVS